MHYKPELNPRTQEEQPVTSQHLLIQSVNSTPGPRWEWRELCSCLFVWWLCVTVHGICFTCLHSPTESPGVGNSRGCVSPSRDALQLSSQGHGYFPYGAYVHMAFLLQNRVNSTVMSLGMLLPAWCPRTDVSKCCSRSKLARAAEGEHLNSELMVEMWPVRLKLVLIPAPSVLLRWDLASCSEQTWALTKCCCILFVSIFIILG